MGIAVKDSTEKVIASFKKSGYDVRLSDEMMRSGKIENSADVLCVKNTRIEGAVYYNTYTKTVLIFEEVAIKPALAGVAQILVDSGKLETLKSKISLERKLVPVLSTATIARCSDIEKEFESILGFHNGVTVYKTLLCIDYLASKLKSILEIMS